MAGTSGARRGIAPQLDPGIHQGLGGTGQEVAAMSRWTSSVSAALQTPGRWTLALRMIRIAISGSAAAST